MKPIKTIWSAKMEAGVLDIYLYDYIEPDSVDWWTGEKIPSETSASAVQKAIEEAGNVAAINVYINSYGGDVKEGMGIYSQLTRSKAQITAYIDGFACSIASVIAMAANKVIMNPLALMMIHNAQMGAYGTSAELRKAADDLDVISSTAVKSYSLKGGDKLPEAKLKTMLDAETWLTAEQCVEYGLADEIASKQDATQTAAEQRLAEAKASYLAMLSAERNPSHHVPQQYRDQKTNAERLMSAFRKNSK